MDKQQHEGTSSSREQQSASSPWSYMSSCSSLFSWPPRSYPCSFCKREFRSAQALGGHMNVHRRDRARLRHAAGSPPPPPSFLPPLPPTRAPPPPPTMIPNLNYPPPLSSTSYHHHMHPPSSSKKQLLVDRELELELGVVGVCVNCNNTAAAATTTASSTTPATTTTAADGHGRPEEDDDDGGLDLELRLGVS